VSKQKEFVTRGYDKVSYAYRGWLAASGFEICRTEFIPEGDDGHMLMLVRAGN
jgi:hypothetical protein